jgi:hypothetical protein
MARGHGINKMIHVAKYVFYFRQKIMNILPRNRDKNIRYPVCVPGHDSPNGTTFLAIVVYDKQKTALVDDLSDLINTRRLSPSRKAPRPLV